MGYLGFIFGSSTWTTTKHDVEVDLTTRYAPKRPIIRQPKPPSIPVPMEIVMTILESAYDDQEVVAYNALLKNAALVCKSWSNVAQKLLFRHVTLSTQTAYIAFQGAVDRTTARGRMLGDSVVRMKVVLDQKQPYRLSHRSFARAVSLCPNLYELGVALFGEGAPGLDIIGLPDESRMKRSVPSFDETTLAILRAGPQISALQFSNWSDNSDSLLQLLDVWPSLASLDISGTTPRLPNETVAPFPCALRELRTNFQVSPSVEFMRWLLHNSRESLRVLDLARQPAPDMLDFLATEHGPTLESLALPTCGTHEGAVSVLKCTALRELKMESAWAAPMLLRGLPHGLQHLAFGVGADTALQHIVQAIKKSDELRVVTMQVWHGGERHPYLPNLRIACALKGVELRQTNDMPAFRVMTRGDPVPSASYPRTRSINNVLYMASRAMTKTSTTDI
ncbi:hypothetical protein DICSQDRAFT_77151 [Dichomitus squalens LYAD-421 SS1]|uniref:uncharacterized protein n=1 Tax=Dichomitus squalens (strain LYAD-421) TaxID=732165 RepID=UPI00044134E5|nr:uncharacterized protein DICSQDRAFT_77151 [Dichomitus squalens LYAD-421 SS1]EJF67434.1 hypothetical protein DICSQDRAFT_77151 [Dichomitus squalens LYAD-421 SS1]